MPLQRSLWPKTLAKKDLELQDRDLALKGVVYLRCLKCGAEWRILEGSSRGLPHGFWKCPNGCNHSK